MARRTWRMGDWGIARVALPAALSIAAMGAHADAQTLRPSLDYKSAETIRDTCLRWAADRDMHLAIAVMDAHGMLVTYAHMDGVSVAVGEVARWKATSSSKFGRATTDFGKLDPPANMPSVASIGGGVPIYTPNGVLLGGVGASGASSADDAACGTAGIEAAGLSAERPAPPQ